MEFCLDENWNIVQYTKGGGGCNALSVIDKNVYF
jgi:hypothetical protein